MLDLLIQEYKKIIPDLTIIKKSKHKLSKFLGKILFFTNYMKTYSSFSLGYKPKIYLPDKEKFSTSSFEHEIIHSIDQKTLFGLVSKSKIYLPDKEKFSFSSFEHEKIHSIDQKTLLGLVSKLYSLINNWIFNILYLFPQCLALLSLPYSNWWLLALLPWPAPFRALAEARAYRRNLERYGQYRMEAYVKNFTGKKYYFMLPIKGLVKKMLDKPSPYKDLQDKLLKKVI